MLSKINAHFAKNPLALSPNLAQATSQMESLEFHPVSMTVHSECAEKASMMLEGEGISFIIEHVDLVLEGKTVPGYRMLVDSRQLQKGVFLVSTAICDFEQEMHPDPMVGLFSAAFNDSQKAA